MGCPCFLNADNGDVAQQKREISTKKVTSIGVKERDSCSKTSISKSWLKLMVFNSPWRFHVDPTFEEADIFVVSWLDAKLLAFCR